VLTWRLLRSTRNDGKNKHGPGNCEILRLLQPTQDDGKGNVSRASSAATKDERMTAQKRHASGFLLLQE